MMKLLIAIAFVAGALAQALASNSCPSPPLKGYNEQGQGAFSNLGAPKGAVPQGGFCQH
jgi:hypothetical protein